MYFVIRKIVSVTHKMYTLSINSNIVRCNVFCLTLKLFISIICDAMGHAAERKEKGEKDDPSRDSNHTPSAIRTDVLSS